MAYLDESGTGDAAREPFVVVASVVVNADKQWKAITHRIRDMADRLVPEVKKDIFKSFHAVELYAGGKVFERDKAHRECWWPILDELLKLPKEFSLPVSFGFMPRAWFEDGGQYHNIFESKEINPVIAAQVFSFLMVTQHVESWMRGFAQPDELAEMIIESNGKTNKTIKAIQKAISDPKYTHILSEQSLRLQVSRIIWPVHFEDKTESSALAIADACAWAIRRRLSRERDSWRFYEPLRSQLINNLNRYLEDEHPQDITCL